jgi:hypothetical protein
MITFHYGQTVHILYGIWQWLSLHSCFIYEKVKLLQYMSWKACRVFGGILPLSLGSTWKWVVSLIHCLFYAQERASRTHWVGPGAGLDIFLRRHISCLYWSHFIGITNWQRLQWTWTYVLILGRKTSLFALWCGPNYQGCPVSLIFLSDRFSQLECDQPSAWGTSSWVRVVDQQNCLIMIHTDILHIMCIHCTENTLCFHYKDQLLGHAVVDTISGLSPQRHSFNS